MSAFDDRAGPLLRGSHRRFRRQRRPRPTRRRTKYVREVVDCAALEMRSTRRGRDAGFESLPLRHLTCITSCYSEIICIHAAVSAHILTHILYWLVLDRSAAATT